MGRVREGKSGREKIKEARKSEKKEDAVVRKGDSLFFSNDLVASEGRKVSSLKRRVRSHVAR